MNKNIYLLSFHQRRFKSGKSRRIEEFRANLIKKKEQHEKECFEIDSTLSISVNEFLNSLPHLEQQQREYDHRQHSVDKNRVNTE